MTGGVKVTEVRRVHTNLGGRNHRAKAASASSRVMTCLRRSPVLYVASTAYRTGTHRRTL